MKVDPNLRGKDLDIVLKTQHLKIGIKGKPPIIDGPLTNAILVDEAAWTVDHGHLELTFPKASSSAPWWKTVIVGDPEIDVEAIEGSKYLDDSLLKQIKDKKDREKEEKKKEEEKKKAEGEKKEEKQEEKSQEEVQKS